MTIKYTWRVSRVRVRDISEDRKNTVVQTYWEKTGTDELGNTGTFTGVTPFTVDATAESFVPFDQLTEEIVLDWIKQQVVGNYQDRVDTIIQEQILEKQQSITEPQLPWVTNSTKVVGDYQEHIDTGIQEQLMEQQPSMSEPTDLTE